MSLVQDIASSRELLANLTLRELRGKYRGTAIGWGWSLLNPLLTMAVFTVVFSVVFRAPIPTGADGLRSFPLFLMCGLLPWTFLSGGLSAGMGALLANANLIQKTYFPRELLVLSVVASSLVTFAIEMVVLALAFLAFGSVPLLWVPGVVGVMALLALFTTGIALALSVLTVWFRDVSHFVAVFLQVWFYATPIIYPLELVRERLDAAPGLVRLLYEANPVLWFVQAMRDLLYSHTLPSAGAAAYLVVTSVGIAWLGWWVFRRFEPRLAEEL